MLDITTPEVTLETKPRIVVIGVGGAGGNAVENMIKENLQGCEFVATNTDSQALQGSNCDKIIQLGSEITRGLGAGANPEIGKKAAEESIDDILNYIDGANMIFIAAGMGGGTGTGAAPIIARHAREKNILTVGVVTKPFDFEGPHRMRQAEQGVTELQKFVDTLIVIPNQNLFYETAETTSIIDAFKLVDKVLYHGVSGVTDLMIKPGLVNLDFNDIRTVMSEMGKAVMGTGEASGAERALTAAENAINNRLLDDDNMKGATAVLVNITADSDLSLTDVTDATNRIRQEVAENANIIFGTTVDETIGDVMRVSIVATGINPSAQNIDDTTPCSTISHAPSHTTPKAVDDGNADSDVFSRTFSTDTSSFHSSNATKTPYNQTDVDTVTDTEENTATQTHSTATSVPVDIDHSDKTATQSEEIDTTHSIPTNLEMSTPVTENVTAQTATIEANTIPNATDESMYSMYSRPTPESNEHPVIDPFLEAELANAVSYKNTAVSNQNTFGDNMEQDEPLQNDTPETKETGGFFKKLFGGIKKQEEPVQRTEPIISHKNSNINIEKNDFSINTMTDGNLQLDSTPDKQDDLDIPSFLRKQIN